MDLYVCNKHMNIYLCLICIFYIEYLLLLFVSIFKKNIFSIYNLNMSIASLTGIPNDSSITPTTVLFN